MIMAHALSFSEIIEWFYEAPSSKDTETFEIYDI